MNNIFITIKKEVRTIFRDKKTFFMLFVTPLIIPAMVALYGVLFESESKEIEYQVGLNYETNEIEEEIVKELNIHTTKYDDKEALEESYNEKNIDAYIVKQEDTYTIYVDDSTTNGMFLSEYLQSYLGSYSDYLTNHYLIEQGIDIEKAYNHFTVEKVTLSKNDFTLVIILNVIIMYVIMAICIAANNMSIQTTATEKENGTLETILTFPIKKSELIIGKYLATVFVSFLAALVSIVLLVSSLYYANTHIEIFKNMSITFGPQAVLFSIFVALSASLFISGAALALTANAKTYKEAQSQASLLNMVTLIPMIVTMTGIQITNLFYCIPICNFVQLLMDIFTNNMDLMKMLITFGTTLIYCIIVIFYVLKAYNSEKILFK